MTNLERHIMFSRGYVNFTTWAEKPLEAPPYGYEYVQYTTKFGNKRWRLAKVNTDPVDIMKEHGAGTLKALVGAGVKPGTNSGAMSAAVNSVIDTVAG